MIDENEKYFVSLGMRKRGGAFVKALGVALDSADHINRQKVKSAFPEYWEEYLKIGKKVHEAQQKEK